MMCPKCGCFMEEKNFSVGSAIAGAAIGAVLLGPIGLAGGLFGLGKHYKCPSCGETVTPASTSKAHGAVGKALTQEGKRQFMQGYNSVKNDD